MADSDGKVRVIIDTNAKEASKDLNNVSKSFDNTAKSAKSVSSVFNSLQTGINNNIQVMREIALAGGQNSKTFKDLAAQTKEYKRMLDEANKSVSKATGELQKQASPIDSLMGKLKGLAGAYISFRGAQMAFNYAMTSVAAFREQERAILQLDQTLKNTGTYTYEYSQRVQALASEIQRYSNYGDEAIIKAQALGQAFAGNTKIAEDLTKATVDFAAATGMDLESAFTLVGKSIGSQTNALSRYGIELDKNMTQSQKADAIQKQLADRFSGSAAQMADTSVQLKNAVGDLAEAIGNNLNPTVKRAEVFLINSANALATWLKNARALKNEVSSLNYDELNTKLKGIIDVKAQLESGTYMNSGVKVNAQTKGSYGDLYRKYLAEEQQAISRMKELKKEQKELASLFSKNKLGSDDYGIMSTKSNGGAGASSSSSNVKKLQDEYEKLQSKVAAARREIEILAIKHGTDSTEVQNAFVKYRDLNSELTKVNDLFKEQKQEITNLPSVYQQAQNQLNSYRAQLQNMGVMGLGGTEQYNQIKNQYIALQTQLKQVDTQINSQVGLNWTNTANTIKSELSSALLTPLQEGETALQRLQNVAFTIFQSIGQEILNKLVFDNAINGISGFIGKSQQGLTAFQSFSAMLGETSTNAAMASSAISTLGASQTMASSVISSTSSVIAASVGAYQSAATAASQLAASLSQVAIATAAESVAKIPYIGGFLAPAAATLTGAAIAAGTAMTTGAALLAGKFEKGGVFQNGHLQAFAQGGVVNQPTYFPMAGGKMGLMGEAGAEAIMPLKRGSDGKLGVEASVQPSTVNVYNYANAQIETVKRPNNETDIYIKKLNSALSSERTQTGFQKALQRNSSQGLQAS